MGLSSSLLAVAVLSAVLPLLAIGLRPPETLRDLEKTFVVGFGTLAAGALVIRFFFDISFFGLAHLLYLLLVVSVPILLVGWAVAALVRKRTTRLLTLLGAAGIVAAGFGLYATHIEPNWLRVDQVAMAGPFDSLRIGVLADLQTPGVGPHERNAVDRLLAAEPDIVLVPGDLFQGDPQQIAANASDFSDLLALIVPQVEVVAVVSGDSDRADVSEIIATDAGALFIDNEIIEFSVQGQPIRLAGVSVQRWPVKLNTLAALTAPTDAFTILLSHRPGVVYELPEGSDVDLIVAGHTHGGQVSLPFIGPPVTFSDIPRDLAAGGLGTVEGYPVYVSTGVGLERFDAPQVRFGVRPSVGVIDISNG